jgi:hypothetical protein
MDEVCRKIYEQAISRGYVAVTTPQHGCRLLALNLNLTLHLHFFRFEPHREHLSACVTQRLEWWSYGRVGQIPPFLH